MTVHAAKGLEFPVVVLGDITYKACWQDAPLFDPALSLLLPTKDEDKALSVGYQLGKLTDEDQDAAEADRLLYVAATRAQAKLILSGCVSLNQAGCPSRLGGWLKRLVETALPDLKDTTLTVEEDKTHDRFQMHVGQTPIVCLFFGDTLSPAQSRLQSEIQTEWPTPLPPPLVVPIPMRIASDLSDDHPVRRITPTRTSSYAPGWLIGKLVHASLSAWRFPNPQFDPWATAFIQNEGFIDEAQIRHGVAQARRRLTRFQGEPLYHCIAQADRRLHEVPYCHTQNGQADRGVIDLLFLEGEQWSVVEFKTDQVADETELRNRLSSSDYLAQLARYQTAGQALLSQLPQVFLCWLNYRGGILVQAGDQIQISLTVQP